MQQPAPGAVERVEERLALHEILRVGLARQEDLRLLQQIAQDEPPLPPTAVTQAFKECQYREEWRCMREAELLARIATTSLTSLTDANLLLISQRVEQVKQIQSQQRGTHMRAGKPGAGAGTSAPLPSLAPGASLTPSPMPLPHQPSPTVLTASMASAVNTTRPFSSSLGAALGLYASPASPMAAQKAVRTQSHRTPPSAGPAGGGGGGGGGGQRVSVGAGGGPLAGRSSVGALGPVGGAGRPASSNSKTTSRASAPAPARTASHQAPPTLMTTEQLRHQLSLGTSPAASPSTQTLLPNMAPPSPSIRTTTPVTNGAVPRSPPPGPRTERSQSMPRTPPRTAPPAPNPASIGAASMAASEAPRFQRLLRLQGTLLSGLQQHNEAGGAQAAVAALGKSVELMQLHFQECMSEAGHARGHTTGAEPLAGAHQHLMARHADWSRLLPLGQLGLTLTDISRLQRLRQHMAARTIQRTVRRHLRRVRLARAVTEANARAARAAQRMRDHAATVIQRYWRGYAARRRCAVLRAAAARDRQGRAVERVRRFCGALRIQRAWRMHRKRRRVRHILAALSDPLSVTPTTTGTAGHLATHTSTPGVAAASTDAPMAGGTGCDCDCGAVVSGSKPSGHAAYGAGGSSGGSWGVYPGTDRVALERAVVRIQAVVRGWLARRSTAVWWARSLAALRARRSSRRAWETHRAYMEASYPLHQQLVDSLSAEARAHQVIQLDAQHEQHQFESNWLGWLTAQHNTAITQPLPRGWVPHRDPATNEDVFLDTRTGALHAHHPAVVQLRAFAASQRALALSHLQQRMDRATQRIEQLQAAAGRERAEIMQEAHRLLVQHLMAGKAKQD